MMYFHVTGCGLLALLFMCRLQMSTSWTISPRKTSGSALFDGIASGNVDRPIVLHRPIRRSMATAEASQLKKQQAELRHAEALQDPSLLSDISFSDLSLPPFMVRSVTEVMGLKQMTDIQRKVFTPASEGKNLVAISRTGSGKTLAFLLPIGYRLAMGKGRIQALIVVPTRELALQIANEAKRLFQYDESISILSIHGGGGIGKDRAMLRRRKTTILVATPGRLLDILESKISISPNILVLDEFDRLLGSPELKNCLPFLPRASKRQTMMFSATTSRKNELYRTFFGSTEHEIIGVDLDDKGSDICHLEQLAVQLPDMDDYLTFLVSILEQERGRKVMVFFPTNKLVKFVHECFLINGWKQCWSIHSHMSNGSRQRASKSFNDSQNGILFSSDVSARGLDYSDVDLVLEYGLASSRALHLHRKGRTARAGKKGRSVVVGMPFEAKQLARLSKDYRPYIVNGHTNMTKEFQEKIRAYVSSGHPVLEVFADSAAKSFAVYYLRHANLPEKSLAKATFVVARAFGLSETWQLPASFDLKPVIHGKNVQA